MKPYQYGIQCNESNFSFLDHCGPTQVQFLGCGQLDENKSHWIDAPFFILQTTAFHCLKARPLINGTWTDEVKAQLIPVMRATVPWSMKTDAELLIILRDANKYILSDTGRMYCSDKGFPQPD